MPGTATKAQVEEIIAGVDPRRIEWLADHVTIHAPELKPGWSDAVEVAYGSSHPLIHLVLKLDELNVTRHYHSEIEKIHIPFVQR